MDTMQLQAWFGILFMPERKAGPDHQPLPSWALTMLDDGADSDDMNKELRTRGYADQDLTWITYRVDDACGYYGIAVAESVRNLGKMYGEVWTWFPQDGDAAWCNSLARAAYALGLRPGARFAWHVTAELLFW